MLTELERERILHRDELTVAERKNLNFRLRKKLNAIKVAMRDINLMLNALPNELIAGHIDNDTVLISLKVSEKLLLAMDPFPIVVDPLRDKLLARRYNLIHFPDGRNGMVDLGYKPSAEEEKLYRAVQDHINELENIYNVDASLDLKLYSFDEYKEMMRPKIDSLLLNGIKYACLTNPGSIPGSVPPDRAKELGYGGIDMRLPLEEQELQRQENEKIAEETWEKEKSSK